MDEREREEMLDAIQKRIDKFKYDMAISLFEILSRDDDEIEYIKI